ncbi:MAG: 50S ribosomal protein L32e [Nitrosopumilaceae archaeon]|nr:50S ribosomal protein L32e [Nitrosopumilaceae archaeon]
MSLNKINTITKNKPNFIRKESWRYKRLETTWRKPKGIDNHQRKQKKSVPPIVKVGYRGPKKTRGLHPSGYTDNLIYNITNLDKLNPKLDGIRIGHSVGTKKREQIVTQAIKMRFKIFNSRVMKNGSKSQS